MTIRTVFYFLLFSTIIISCTDDPIEMDPIEMEPISEAQAVINKYLEATGGVDAHNAIEDYTMVTNSQLGPYNYEITEIHKIPSKHKVTVVIDSNLAQIFTLNATKGVVGIFPTMDAVEMDTIIMESDEFESRQASRSKEIEYDQIGVSLQLDGTEVIDGNNAHKVLVTFPSGQMYTNYYDEESGLKVRHTRGPEGDMLMVNYEDYMEVDGGILIPHTVSQASGQFQSMYTVSSFEVNTGYSDDEFDFE